MKCQNIAATQRHGAYSTPTVYNTILAPLSFLTLAGVPHSQLHVYYTAVHTTFNITQLQLLCPSLSQFTVTYVHSTNLKPNQG